MANAVPRREAEKRIPQRAERLSAYRRGYGKRWQATSKGWLARYPLCAECERQGMIEQAECVDHIRPHRGDMGLFWDAENWQGLCNWCHNRKTNMEDNLKTYRRVVVTGEPGSGKTTYVNARKKIGDFVWDWDCVMREMTGLPMHNTPQDLIGIVNAMATAMVDAMATRPPPRDCWLIFREPVRAKQVADRISAELVVCDSLRVYNESS